MYGETLVTVWDGQDLLTLFQTYYELLLLCFVIIASTCSLNGVLKNNAYLLT